MRDGRGCRRHKHCLILASRCSYNISTLQCNALNKVIAFHTVFERFEGKVQKTHASKVLTIIKVLYFGLKEVTNVIIK